MQEDKSFWQHLDDLRSVIVRCLVATFLVTIVAFFFKDLLFSVVMAPQSDEFVTYSLLRKWIEVPAMNVPIINTALAQQFIVHIQVSVAAGFLLVSPYLIYELIHYLSPALYQHERRYTYFIIIGAYIMFILGILLSYFVIFPFAFRFLGTYQVQDNVANYINLDSYIGTLILLCLMMGAMFELPIVCLLLSRMGILTALPMRRYRRHALVVILVLSAIITPTGDAFTLLLVALPIYMLYEFSILLVRKE